MLRPGIRRLFRLALGKRESIEAELVDELQFHLDARAHQLEMRGLPPDEARREAIRYFADIDDTRRQLKRTAERREGKMRMGMLIETTTQDVRFVARQLRRSPGFTLAVAATLALGIGANALMFGVLDRLLLRPPSHVLDADRLAYFRMTRHHNGDTWEQSAFSYADYRDVRDRAARDSLGIAGVATHSYPQTTTLGSGADARKVSVMLVSRDYFTVLGPRPQLGRFFTAEETAEPVGHPVAVVGFDFWKSALGGDEHALGKTLRIGKESYTVVGVAPRHFSGIGSAAVDAWLPITAAEPLRFAKGPTWMTSRGAQWLSIVARMAGDEPVADTTSFAQARAKLTIMMREALASTRRPDSLATSKFASVLRNKQSRITADAKVARLLLAVSVFVLLVACANVANLMLARSVRRQQEIAVRLALGISQRRLVTMLTIESAILAVLGGVGSLLVVHWGGAIIGARFLSGVTAWSASLVDGRVLAFTLVATLLVTGLVTLAPAIQGLRASVSDALKAGARAGRTRRQRRASTALLLSQVSLCTVLLVGTGLFVRSMQKLNAVRIGLDARKLLIADFDLRGMGKSADEIDATYRQLAERARAFPDVEEASVSMGAFFWSSFATGLAVPGLEKLPTVSDGGPYMNAIDEHFIPTTGMRIVRGRGITAADRASRALVVVVNDLMAKRFWPGQDALGKCMKIGGDTMPCSTVIGVSETARRDQFLQADVFQYFIPLEMNPPEWKGSRVLTIRTKGESEAHVESIRRLLQAALPGLPFADVKTMHSLYQPELKSWQLGTTMFTSFGLLALAIAIVGLYGTLAYDIAQRSRELSIRLALGARAEDLVRLVMRQGMMVVALGIAIGCAIAIGGGRWIRDLLFETKDRDPLVFVAVVIVLALVGAAAAFAPARRATKVDIRHALSVE